MYAFGWPASPSTALAGVHGGTLRIGAVTTAEHVLPPLLVPFTMERPDVRLELERF